MLEANTDRSYFMIGAVIVGALLIGLAIYLFTSDGLVATSINDILTNTFTKANSAITDIDVSGRQ